jgi:hypothetical protein
MVGPTSSGGTVPVVQIRDRPDSVAEALQELGLRSGRPVLVSVGGAGGMTLAHLDSLRGLLRDHVLPVLAAVGAGVVDGGTNAGVMQVMGQAVRESPANIPVLGVAAVGTVRVPGRASANGDVADLDPDHTAILLVPGGEWGDESRWLATVAEVLAAGAPSATLVVNGGEIAYTDLRHSVNAGRPVVVVAGTGRTADEITAALRGEDADPRAVELARSGLVREVDLTDGAGAARMLEVLLSQA